LSHESIGGFIEYSSSSTSGVAVGTMFPVIDDDVKVGVVMVACDVAAWPDDISGFNEPPDIADSVSSFSSLTVMRQNKTTRSLIKSKESRIATSYTSDFVSSFVLFDSPSFFFLFVFFDLAFSRRLRRKPETISVDIQGRRERGRGEEKKSGINF
jgi:hypothetical protein